MILFLMHLKQRANGSVKRMREAEKNLKALRKNEIPVDIDEWIIQSIDDPIWEIRNISIKCIGLARRDEFLSNLCEKSTDLSQKGFIRRNAFRSLTQLKTYNSDTQKCVMHALDDEYWEVRSEASNYIFANAKPDLEMEKLILDRIFKSKYLDSKSLPLWFTSRAFKEKNFEVRRALTLALGTVAKTRQALHALELLITDPHWSVRDAAILSYCNTSVRLNENQNRIREVLKDIDLTCPSFRPVFPIRETFNEMIDTINLQNTKSGT